MNQHLRTTESDQPLHTPSSEGRRARNLGSDDSGSGMTMDPLLPIRVNLSIPSWRSSENLSRPNY